MLSTTLMSLWQLHASGSRSKSSQKYKSHTMRVVKMKMKRVSLVRAKPRCKSMCKNMQSMSFGHGVKYSVDLELIAFRRYFSGQVSHVTE